MVGSDHGPKLIWDESIRSGSNRIMQTLPNEVLEIIGLYLDLPSIGYLRRTAKPFVAAFDDDIFWRHRVSQDYPILARTHVMTSWQNQYREMHYWQKRFRTKFPELQKEAEWVAQMNRGDWMELYRDVKNHPLLIHPAIKRLCENLKEQCRRAHFWHIVDHESLDCSFGSDNLAMRLFAKYMGDFITFTVRDSQIADDIGVYLSNENIDFGRTICRSETFIRICGSLVTQANGARIWFPHARKTNAISDMAEIRFDYV
jgi:hypothetical protein